MTTKASLRPAILALIFGGLALSVMLGLRQAMGVLLAPVAQDTGWSIAGLGFGFALMNLMWGAAQPVAGALSDRYGPIPVILGAVVLAVIGLSCMAFTEQLLWFNVGLGVFIGAALAGVGFPIILGAIVKRTPPARRSMFQGIGSAIGSFGMFAMVLIAQDLIDLGGWQFALLTAFGLMAVVAVSTVGLATPILAPEASIEPSQSELRMTQVLRYASTERSFLLLTLGFFVCGFHVAFIATHLPNFAVSCGLSPETGAFALALIGLFNMVGSLAAGWLGSRFPQRYILSAIYGARAVLIVVFLAFPVTEWSLYLFTAAFGLLWLSTVPGTNSIVATLFGPKFVGTLFGMVFLSHQIGAFLGAWLAGVLYEVNGDYALVWWISVALGVMAAVIHLPIKEQLVSRLTPAHAAVSP